MVAVSVPAAHEVSGNAGGQVVDGAAVLFGHHDGVGGAQGGGADEESGEGDGGERGLIRQTKDAARRVLEDAVVYESGRKVSGL